MSHALYHQEGKAPQRFAILAQHEDRTVDLGPEDGAPVITNCVVLDDPKPGHATLDDDDAAADLAAKAAGAEPADKHAKKSKK